MSYSSFIDSKRRHVAASGFRADVNHHALFPFQQAIVEWALDLGRAAIFADTGLGKTFMQLSWAEQVYQETGRPVLLLAPLAVAHQTEREAKKFGIDGAAVVDGDCDQPISIANYEKLHRFDCSRFGGVVLDESSILKNAQGRTRNLLIRTFAETPYRLACTATPAPNDHTELGNHSQFLGLMDEAIMRARWFVNDLGDTVQPWRLKRHAVQDFWRWVASWARMVGQPSDMGDFEDAGYDLPKLHEHLHHVSVDITSNRDDGMLFRVPDMSATSVHKEKRLTAGARARYLAALVKSEPDEPWAIWCETDYEQDAVMEALPDAVDVRGSMKPEEKAKRLLAFVDKGGMLVTKPKIAAMGLNWQHAARMAFVGGSYSYEAYYQAVRRQWRFGQQREVHAHVVMSKTEAAMWTAIRRKADGHARMKRAMFAASRRAALAASAQEPYQPSHIARCPAWLTGSL
jgi:superfamily II DNA or RNA helicase